jgi:multiple sugar transport system permease protein
VTTTTRAPDTRRAAQDLSKSTTRRKRGAFGGVPYLLPSAVVLVVVSIAPIFMTLYYSLTTYSILDPGDFVGFDNYIAMLNDKSFQTSVWQTMLYTLIVVPLQTVLSLVISEVLAKRFRNRFGGFARSVLFVPVLSSLVIVGVVWRFLLDSDFGLVNQLLGLVGIPHQNWLGQPMLALITVALVSVWKNVGYFMVIYYAGIMGINNDLYEAASIDGAGPVKQFFNVTVPSLKPVTILIVILGTIWSFQVFDLVYTMTGGGPGGATTTFVMSIYQSGFQNYQMGYASAMAVVLLIIILAVSLIQMRLLGKEK